MKRTTRLTRSQDFMRVRRIGKSYAHPLLVFLVSRGEQDCTRIGIITGKTLGNAVTRNRAKRRLRAAVSTLADNLIGSWDIVLIARKPVLGVDFSELTFALRTLVQKAGLDKDDAE